eukprot:4014372-Pyramimonas_sp.AAC.1
MAAVCAPRSDTGPQRHSGGRASASARRKQRCDQPFVRQRLGRERAPSVASGDRGNKPGSKRGRADGSLMYAKCTASYWSVTLADMFARNDL